VNIAEQNKKECERMEKDNSLPWCRIIRILPVQ